MPETSQTINESRPARHSRAARAIPAVGAAVALAVVMAVGSAAGSGLFPKASPTGSGAVATRIADAIATPSGRQETSTPLRGPTADSSISGPAPTETCIPEYNNGCLPVAAPTRERATDQGGGPGFTVHVPIFEYHRVKPPAGETGYSLDLVTPPDLFQAQMAAMSAAGWHTITMGQLGDFLRLGIQPDAKTFVVTFDDGYEDGYTYAYPILARNGFVGTFFVVGSQIGKADHLTADELQALNAAGCEIGNHTMDHVDLVPLTPDGQYQEIFGNSAVIARDIGVWPQSFAYPAGFTDAGVMAAVAATPGLETAVVQQSSKPQTWANRWQLPRIRVGPGTYPQDLLDKATRYVP